MVLSCHIKKLQHQTLLHWQFELVFISQGHNLYKLQYISLEEVKIVSFNNDFKVRLSKVTY